MAIPLNQVVVQSPQVLANQVQKELVTGLDEFESVDFADFIGQQISDEQLPLQLFLGGGLTIEGEEVFSLVEFANSGPPGLSGVKDGQREILNLPLDLSGENEDFSSTLVIREPGAVSQTTIHPGRSDHEVISIASHSVAHQAVRAVQSEFVPFRQSPIQSLTIEINPPELGRIHIQVELVSDQLAAQIVASEIVSAELLSQQKYMLLDSLSEFGYGEASISISHEPLDDDSEWSGSDGEESEGTLGDLTLDAETIKSNKSVVIVGLNLVA